VDTKVKVGGVATSDGREALLEWIVLIADGIAYRKFLKPEMPLKQSSVSMAAQCFGPCTAIFMALEGIRGLLRR
jgi:hypothetical protein